MAGLMSRWVAPLERIDEMKEKTIEQTIAEAAFEIINGMSPNPTLKEERESFCLSPSDNCRHKEQRINVLDETESPSLGWICVECQAQGEAIPLYLAKLTAECFYTRRQIYQSYLKSYSWKLKREQALERVSDINGNPICEARLRCCGALATQVHHLTYDNVFQEPLWDLRAVCAPCHEELSRRDNR